MVDTTSPFLLYENGSMWLPAGCGLSLVTLEGFAPWDDYSSKYMAQAFLVELPRGALIIGRVRATDRPTLSIPCDSVAKRHATIYWRDDRFWLHDLSSPCGTPVNGVKSLTPRALAAGDQISVGAYVRRRLIFIDPAHPGQGPPYLDAALDRLARG